MIILPVIFLVLAAIIIFLIFRPGQKSKSNKEEITQLFRSKKEIVIDCFGDSITWGLYKDEGELQSKQTYPKSLEDYLNKSLKEAGFDNTVTTINDGISGDCIQENTYQRIVCDPDIVILLYSGNNFWFEQPYEGNLEANIKALQEKGSILYLANYPLYPETRFYEAYSEANNYIAKAAKTTAVPLVDINYYFEELVSSGAYLREALFSQDCVHLTPLGYDLLGERIAQEIIKDMKQ